VSTEPPAADDAAAGVPPRMMSRRQRVPVHPVLKWFPGRGSAFVDPNVKIFFSTRIRANLLWWKQEKAPRQVFLLGEPITENSPRKRTVWIPMLILTKISSSQECHDEIVELLLEKKGLRILNFYDA
jgi:hypothetical protein